MFTEKINSNMKQYLKETTALALYAGLLVESSQILRGLGPNVDGNLKRLIIGLHQNKTFSHEAGNITKADKVVWGDIKGQYATGYSPGKAIAIVGTEGSAVIYPYSTDT